MNLKQHILFLLLIVCAVACTQAQEENPWRFQRDQHGIQVYYRDAENSNIKELKVIMQVKSSLSAVVHVLNDIDIYTDWVYECIKSYKVSSISDAEFYYYNLSRFPWPFSNREFVFLTKTYQDSSSLIVHSDSWAKPDLLPLNENYVRVRHGWTKWAMKPLPGGIVEIEYTFNIDPGGAIPAFFVNLALAVGPTKSFKKFRELVEMEKYQKMQVAYITELQE